MEKLEFCFQFHSFWLENFCLRVSFHRPPSITLVPCSLYIDDRNSGPSESISTARSDELRIRFAAAKAAVFLVVRTLTSVKYRLGFISRLHISVSSLTSDLEAFYMLHDKQDSFLSFVNSILSGTSFSILTFSALRENVFLFALQSRILAFTPMR